MSASEPTKFGKYWLTDRIAVGGMAELYRGKISGDEGFEKAVAVKKILPHLAAEQEAVNYFIDEARLAARWGKIFLTATAFSNPSSPEILPR